MNLFFCFVVWWFSVGVLAPDNDTDFSVQHADGMFEEDSPESVRVRIQMEEPVLVNDVMRVQQEEDSSGDACSDFYRYCNATGAQYDTKRLQCSCDSACDLLGNCCWDAPLPKQRKTMASCHSLPEMELGFYFIDRCPELQNERDEVKSEKARTLCESTNTSYDPFTSIPVSTELLSYRNIYCAICNDEREPLQPWIFGIHSCPNMSLKNCNISTRAPENFTQVLCDQTAIAECPNGDDPNSESCDLYYAPVHQASNNSVVYKNKFCAFCRGVTDLGCLEALITSSAFPGRINAPFSIIFHIDFWHGSPFIGGNERCEPEVPVCREVTCRENVCTLDVTERLRLVTSSCTKWTIDGTVYVLNGNGDLTLFNESSSNKIVCYTDFTFAPDQPILTLVCISISIACLLAKMVIFVFFDKNKKISQQTIFMLCVSVLCAQLLFVIGSNEKQWGVGCVVIGVLVHYLFLVSLFWTNVLSFDIWRTFSTMASTVATSPCRRFLHYNLYCWLCPLFLVTLAVVFEWGIGYEPLQPGYGLNFCWISRKLPLLAFFVCPLGVLLCVNAFLFSWTACRISTVARAARVARDSVGPDKIRFILYFKLAFIMGLTWVFGFSAAFVDSEIMWCFFIVLNALQGLYLLLAFSRFRFKTYFVRFRMFVRKATQTTNSRSTKSSEDYSTSKM